MERVRRFREKHPLKREVIGGREWEYIAAGRGERALLLLPGALAVADSVWLTLPHFEDRFRGDVRKVYVKCEHYNLTGSIKDRMALYILQQAYYSRNIREGDIIVEATSGRTTRRNTWRRPAPMRRAACSSV